MNINNVYFYNHFGAGDVFESREFVRDWISKSPVKNYYYAHGKNPKLLRDMEELKYTEVTPLMHPMYPYILAGEDLYINTWIGRDGKYVLPGIGCTVEMLYKMHNDMLAQLQLSSLSRPLMEYIPKINYLVFDIEDTIEFIDEYKNEKMILFSNGPVQSNQAENFDFTPILDAIINKYKDILFLVTSRTDLKAENLFYTDDITRIKDGNDLNELSYLSLFCDTIIGRNSGPHVFAQVYDNWMDSNKAILSFTYKRSGSHFVLSDNLPMRKYWSPATDLTGVCDKISEVLERNI